MSSLNRFNSALAHLGKRGLVKPGAPTAQARKELGAHGPETLRRHLTEAGVDAGYADRFVHWATASSRSANRMYGEGLLSDDFQMHTTLSGPATRRATSSEDGVPASLRARGSEEAMPGFVNLPGHVYVDGQSVQVQLAGTRRRSGVYDARFEKVDMMFSGFSAAFAIKGEFEREASALWRAAVKANVAGAAPKCERTALLAFLAYLNQPLEKISFSASVKDKAAKETLRDEVRAAVVLEFDRITKGANVHTITSEISFIGAYNWAVDGLSAAGRLQILADKRPVPALLKKIRAGEGVSGLVDFAGQDSNYISELRDRFRNYPQVNRMVERLIATLTEQVKSSEAKQSGYFDEFGFDILKWLNNPELQPPAQILTSSPYSQSLIALTQFANLMVLLSNGYTMDDIIKLIGGEKGGATGHSQGIMPALVVARGKSGEELIADMQAVVTALFWQGIYMQDADQNNDFQTNLSVSQREAAFFADDKNKNITAASFGSGKGGATPMITLRTARPQDDKYILSDYLIRFNAKMSDDQKIDHSLTNGDGFIILSGPKDRLLDFLQVLNAGVEKEKKDFEDRKPTNGRLPIEFSGFFLAVSAAFHSRYMKGSNEKLDAKLSGLIAAGKMANIYDPAQLKAAVFDTADGHDLRNENSSDAMRGRVCEIQAVLPTLWTEAVKPARGVKYAVHFGPGDAIAKMTGRNLRGTGGAAIAATTLSGLATLLSTDEKKLPKGSDYTQYAPRLVTLPDGSVVIDNRFTRMYKANPIAGGGMTPTTTDPDIIAAVIDANRQNVSITTLRDSYNFGDIPDATLEAFAQAYGPASGSKFANMPDLADANFDWWNDSVLLKEALASIKPTGQGYIVEIAGGGQPTESIFRWRLNLARRMLKPGETLWVNLLWMADAFKFENDLIIKMREEGYPIEGAVISAGNPSPEEVIAYYERLRAAGIEYVALKPGTDPQIENNLKLADELAKKHPGWPIRMQIELGMAGGHRGMEGQAFLLKHYDAIRQHDNISLGIYGGMRNGEDAWSFLSGEWSVKYDGIRRPFDEVGLGTRLMATQEVWTHADVKQGLVDTKGSEDWLKSHTLDGVGGVVETRSAMNAPLHLAKTTLSDMLNKMDAWAREGTLETPEHRAIIAFVLDGTQKQLLVRSADMDKVPADFIQAKADGTFWAKEKQFYAWLKEAKPRLLVPLTQSSLADVLNGMIRTMSNPRAEYAPFKFYDVSFTKKAFNWMSHIEDRLGVPGKARVVQDWKELERDPEGVFAKFNAAYGAKAASTLLSPIDVSILSQVTRVPGKPAPYLPDITADWTGLLKSDGLFYSHYKDRNASEWEPGPQAVMGITEVDEPALEVFEGMTKHVIAKLKDEMSADAVIPAVGLFGEKPQMTAVADIRAPKGVLVTQMAGYYQASIEEEKVDRLEFLEFLAQQGKGALRYLVESGRVVQDSDIQNNYVHRLLDPEKGMKVRWKLDDEGRLAEISLIEASTIHEGEEYAHLQLLLGDPYAVATDGVSADMTLVINHERPALVGRDLAPRSVPLVLGYRLTAQGKSPVHEIMEGRDQRIVDFYNQVLFDGKAAGIEDLSQNLTANYKLSREDVFRYMRATRINIDANVRSRINKLVPADGLTLKTSLRITGYENDKKGRRIAVEGLITDAKGNALDMADLPINIFFKIAWEPMIASVFPKEVMGNIFNLLHFSNGFTHTSQGVRAESVFFIQGNFAKAEVASRKLNEASTVEFKIADRVQRKYLAAYADVEGNALSLDIGKTYSARIIASELIERSTDRADAGKLSRTYETVVEIVDSKSGRIVTTLKYNTENNQTITDNPLTWLIGKMATKAKAEVEGSLVGTDVTAAPTDMTPYAIASDDLNPIHRDGLIAKFTDDPRITAPIAHGMWSSENGERVLAQLLNGARSRIKGYQASFTAMVKPGAKVTTEVKIAGTENGFIVYNVTSSVDGAPVLKAKALVEQEKTAFVNTGQGSQETGMGKALYDKSPAAKEVFDRAFKYASDHLGFDLRRIMWDNPKEYIMPDGTILRHPEGVLNLTQFTQPGITINELAENAYHIEQGANVAQPVIAGHSLGEYVTLTQLGILSIEQVMAVVYHRGLTMQKAVKRDADGRSNYAMYVVRPWVKGIKEKDLEAMVKSILADNNSGKKNRFGDPLHIEVVNYNVTDSQYSVVGDLELLEELKQRLDALETAPAAKKKDGDTKSYVQVPGIDVPFHSGILKGGIGTFRNTLLETFKDPIAPEKLAMLVNLYIPNLVAKPFSLSREYVEYVQKFTGSHMLAAVLTDWASYSQRPGDLSRQLVVELLAYQFASPVLWTKTMEVMFKELGVRRLVENGHKPDLKGMVQSELGRTLKLPYLIKVLNIEIDREEVQYLRTGEKAVELGKIDTPTPDAKPVAGVEVVAQVIAAAAAPVATEQKATAPVAQAAPMVAATGAFGDLPKDKAALVAIRVIASVISGKPFSEIDPNKNIKAYGDSGKQNAFTSAVKGEFALDRSDMADITMTEIASAVDAYKDIGETLKPQLTQLITESLAPFQVSEKVLRDHLANERLLTASHVPAALAFIVAYAASNKPADGDKVAKLKWLDQAVDAYGSAIGQSIPRKAAMAQAIAMPTIGAVQAAPVNVPDLDPAKFTELSLRITVAMNAGKSLSDVPSGATIKGLGLDSGKSNALFSAIAAEFGFRQDGADAKPLSDVAKEIGTYKGGDVNGFLHNHIATFITEKLQPAGVSRQELFSYLTQKRGFPANQAMGFMSYLALGNVGKLSPEPSGLKDKASALAWVDQVISAYGNEVGANLAAPAAGGAVAVGGGTLSADAFKELEDRWFSGLTSPMARLALDMLEQAGYNPYSTMMPELNNAEARAAQEELKFWREEYGQGDAIEGRDGRPGLSIVKAMAAAFRPEGVVLVDDTANEAKFKSEQLYYALLNGRLDPANQAHANELMILTTQVVNLATEQSVAMLRASRVKAERASELLANRGRQDEANRLSKAAEFLDKVYELARVASNEAPTYANLDSYQMVAPSDQLKPDKDGRPTLKFVARPGVQTADEFVTDVFAHVTMNGKSYPKVTLEISSDDALRLHDDESATSQYAEAARKLLSGQTSFTGQTILITGAQVEGNGMTNMGAEIAKIIWQGGGTVVFTSHFYGKGDVDNVTDPYNPFLKRMLDLYHKYKGRGAKAIAIPANAASGRDTKAVIDHIYNDPSVGGLGLRLDGVMPFAALNPLSTLDQWMPNQARFEFARRVLEDGVNGLLAALVNKLKTLPQGGAKRPFFIDPDSINPNTMRGNTTYGLAKGKGHAAANAVTPEWDDWGKLIHFVELQMGLIVTPLTAAISAASYDIEQQYGVRLFESHEMAKLIMSLTFAEVGENADKRHQALRAVLSGALHHMMDNPEDDATRKFFPQIYERLMSAVVDKIADKKLEEDFKKDFDKVMGTAKPEEVKIKKIANWNAVYGPAELASEADIALVQNLDHLDPRKLAVVAGYGYVGPWGDAEIRRDYTLNGDLSMESVIKAASLHMGLITWDEKAAKWNYNDGEKDNKYSDQEVYDKLKMTVLKGMGIRKADPKALGFDPLNHVFYEAKVIRGDAIVSASSGEDADAVVAVSGEKAQRLEKDGEPLIRLKDGSIVHVPKLKQFRRYVQGQVPTGWDAKRYGITDEIIASVDPVTLYTLVAMLNAALRGGFTPTELFMSISRSEVGNYLASGLGGGKSLHEMFVLYHLGKILPKDLLAKMLANDVSQGSPDQEWAGGTRGGESPTAACATAIMSIHAAAHQVGQKRGIRFAWSGGTDGISPSGVGTFGEDGHNATGETSKLLNQGRNPRGMSPGNDSQRIGFLESEGAVVFAITDLALVEELGLIAHAGIAMADSASGGHGDSITAPDTGIAHIASSSSVKDDPKGELPRYKITDLEFRRSMVDQARSQYTAALEQSAALAEESRLASERGDNKKAKDFLLRAQTTRSQARIQFEAAQDYWGHNFWKDYGSLSQIEGALSVWGLSVADIGLIVQHGTATEANDKNEAKTYNAILEHASKSTIKDKIIRFMDDKLGDDYERVAQVAMAAEMHINSLPDLFKAIDAILSEAGWTGDQIAALREDLLDEIIVDLTFQAVVVNAKSVDGHPKGPAGGWQMIDAIQSMHDGTAAGNRAMRALDPVIQELGSGRLIYANRNLERGRSIAGMVRATLIGTFGFGRTTAGAVLVNPTYLMAAMTPERRATYRDKHAVRAQKMVEMGVGQVTGKQVLFTRYDGIELAGDRELDMNLNPGVRLVKDADGKTKYSSESAGVSPKVESPLPDRSFSDQAGGFVVDSEEEVPVNEPTTWDGPRPGGAAFKPAARGMSGVFGLFRPR